MVKKLPDTLVEWAQPEEGLAVRLEIADPVMDSLSPEEREKLRQALGNVAILASTVLAFREKSEQTDMSLEERFDFIACHLALLATIYTTDESEIPFANQEYPFEVIDREIDYFSSVESEIDEIDAMAENAFAAWMTKVDEIVFDMAGCSVHDLPDVDYRAFFETQATPFQAADAALLNAGWLN